MLSAFRIYPVGLISSCKVINAHPYKLLLPTVGLEHFAINLERALTSGKHVSHGQSRILHGKGTFTSQTTVLCGFGVRMTSSKDFAFSSANLFCQRVPVRFTTQPPPTPHSEERFCRRRKQQLQSSSLLSLPSRPQKIDLAKHWLLFFGENCQTQNRLVSRTRVHW